MSCRNTTYSRSHKIGHEVRILPCLTYPSHILFSSNRWGYCIKESEIGASPYYDAVRWDFIFKSMPEIRFLLSPISYPNFDSGSGDVKQGDLSRVRFCFHVLARSIQSPARPVIAYLTVVKCKVKEINGHTRCIYRNQLRYVDTYTFSSGPTDFRSPVHFVPSPIDHRLCSVQLYEMSLTQRCKSLFRTRLKREGGGTTAKSLEHILAALEQGQEDRI